MSAPEWVKRYLRHLDAMDSARRGQALALQMRCAYTFDDLSRCTADRTPEHEHRDDWRETPGALQALRDEEKWRSDRL